MNEREERRGRRSRREEQVESVGERQVDVKTRVCLLSVRDAWLCGHSFAEIVIPFVQVGTYDGELSFQTIP